MVYVFKLFNYNNCLIIYRNNNFSIKGLKIGKPTKK